MKEPEAILFWYHRDGEFFNYLLHGGNVGQRIEMHKAFMGENWDNHISPWFLPSGRYVVFKVRVDNVIKHWRGEIP